RRKRVRLMSGEHRCFGVNANRTVVNIPYPALGADRTLRTWTCGIALQCAPSKDRVAHYPLQQLSSSQLAALTIVEAQVALGWVASRWPGLLADLRRLLPDLEVLDGDLEGPAMFERAIALARSGRDLKCHPLLGQLPPGVPGQRSFLAAIRKVYGRMPW